MTHQGPGLPPKEGRDWSLSVSPLTTLIFLALLAPFAYTGLKESGYVLRKPVTVQEYALHCVSALRKEESHLEQVLTGMFPGTLPEDMYVTNEITAHNLLALRACDTAAKNFVEQEK